MKFLRKYQKELFHKNKSLQPYIHMLTGIMTVVTDVAAIIFISTVVYDVGFILSATEVAALDAIYNRIWILFLLDVTLHLILGRRLKQESYKKLGLVLGVLLYITLIPAFFPCPDGFLPLAGIWTVLDSKYYQLIILLLFSFFYLSNSLIRLLGRRTNPSLILAVSFLVIILVGTGLLMLPRSTYYEIAWVDALYISTSAVCVTGLTSVDVASTFTPIGFTIIILLIQVGGLGVMTLTSFFAVFFMGNTSLYNQLVIRDMVSSDSLSSLLSTLLYILGFTLVIEGVGMLVIWGSIHGVLDMTLEQELAFSAFHSISAFCNAGFSTLPGNLGNPLLMQGHASFYIFISFLIILGGIGFPLLVNLKDIVVRRIKVLYRCLHTRERMSFPMYHPFNLNTRIVFATTLCLLLLGTLTIAFFEWNHAFTGMSVVDKWTHAFFNAVSPRTAGFTSVELTTFGTQSILFYMFLMWIGGGAQSTAGGIKVNTFAVGVLNLTAIIRGTNRVEVLGRELSLNSIRRANATIVMSVITLFLFLFVLTILEPGISVMTLLFECISAMSTVGSSLNASSLFSDSGKIVIVLLMFLGRVGLITFILGIVKHKKTTKYKYPADDIIIS